MILLRFSKIPSPKVCCKNRLTVSTGPSGSTSEVDADMLPSSSSSRLSSCELEITSAANISPTNKIIHHCTNKY